MLWNKSNQSQRSLISNWDEEEEEELASSPLPNLDYYPPTLHAAAEWVAAETGMYWTHELCMYSRRNPYAPESARTDWHTLASWLGVVDDDFSNECAVKAGRAWCGYLTIRQAPTLSLEWAFQTARALAVEQAWTVILPPPQVMDVFDRFALIPEEISRARSDWDTTVAAALSDGPFSRSVSWTYMMFLDGLRASLQMRDEVLRSPHLGAGLDTVNRE